MREIEKKRDNLWKCVKDTLSLLVAGLDHLYSEAGVFDEQQTRWPTIVELLAWLRAVKLKGRAAMWQASAERILLALTYGEFGSVLNTQDNSHVAELLRHNVVLEMDGFRGPGSTPLDLHIVRPNSVSWYNTTCPEQVAIVTRSIMPAELSAWRTALPRRRDSLRP